MCLKGRELVQSKIYDGLEGMIPYNYAQEKKSPAETHPPRHPSPRHPSPHHSSPHHSSPHHPSPHHPSPHHPSPPLPSPSPKVAAPTVVVQPRQAVKLHGMPWFHGNISREQAEKMLRPFRNSQYLVRESQNYPGDYTLCVSYEDKVEHYRVRTDERNWVTVDDEQYFENLFKLVEHYQRDSDGLCCRLKYSVNKQKDIEFVVSREEFNKMGWAIPRKHLHKKSMIGKGEFGEVWLGEYQGSKIAIKMLKDLKDEKASQRFLTEASIMTTLRHSNLVCLIGVSLDSNPIYLVTEYMAKGSLVDYLRTRGRAVILKRNQLDFAKDVCKGMVYLESQSFVHRDLAARNVLIADDDVAKVSDFGLTREVLSKQGGTKLPVKWTAPEALRGNNFSNKSDVWSYGILLWEIYSYGRVPYPRVPVEDVASHVDRGYRMDAPDGCPDVIYSIMQDCWNKDRTQRPNFARIERTLDSIPLP